MKTKAIFLMAILLLKGTCGGEMTAEQSAAFDKEWARSKQLAILYYPDADKKGTPLRNKLVELNMRMKESDDSLFNTPNQLFVLTVMAASELGLKPAKPYFSDEHPATSEPSAPKSRSFANGEGPKYVTSEQIKVYWYNQMPTPRSLEANYHPARKAREQFVIDVKEGKYDLSAEKAAAEYNKQEALKFGDNERATLCEAELSRIAEQEAEIQRKIDADKALAEAQRARIQAQMANAQVMQLRNELDILNADMGRIRRSIQNP